MALLARAWRALIGEPTTLDAALVRAFPELGAAAFRRGGLPPRVGGWFLGVRSVAGITLGRTVWLAPDTDLTPELLLHEMAHVVQWRTVRWFALRYVWESVRRGYMENRYEVEARLATRTRLGSVRAPAR